MMISKKSIFLIGYVGWCLLGFNRGMHSYIYHYTNNKTSATQPPMYCDKIIYGFYGSLLYAIPTFLPFMMYKELYRLEVDLRNLEHEKNSRNYNDILL